MIIENATLYSGINERIKIALDYIQNTDFIKLETGNYDIDGKNIYALVNEYETKDAEDSFLEGHRNYIDVQYLIEGVEQIGFASLANQQPVKYYDSNEDYLLFKDKCSKFSLKKGMFAIFFPQDLHMPGIKIHKSLKVKKVVVKVKI